MAVAIGRSGTLWSPPIASGTAVLRYLLYDINRIISRTASYDAVTGMLALPFLGTILVSQPVLPSSFSGSSVAVAASTVVVAAHFQPLRRRLATAVGLWMRERGRS